MTALTFTLRDAPTERLDLSCLTPKRLDGLSEAEIVALPINTTRTPLTVGDVFRIEGSKAEHVHIVSAADGARLDNIGAGMAKGRITVEGSAGAYLGRGLTGGELTIEGDCGPFAGSGMTGGHIRIQGNAGDFLGAPRTGEMQGMKGGVITVSGRAGARAGDRLRRGVIAIGGDAGDHAASRMIAGTVLIFGNCGALPGYLMRRGSIILGGEAASWTPTFIESGGGELTYLRMLAASLAGDFPPATLSALRAPVRRLAGDMATLGKGEILRLES
jgi:formylmethanofuran dehydrogenase subunit C